VQRLDSGKELLEAGAPHPVLEVLHHGDVAGAQKMPHSFLAATVVLASVVVAHQKLILCPGTKYLLARALAIPPSAPAICHLSERSPS
jgi:hypothetical protein